MIATPLQLVFWTLVGLAIVLGSSLLAYGKGFKEGKTLGISIGCARPIGKLLSFESHAEGIDAQFKVAGTIAGDDSLLEPKASRSTNEL